MDFKKLLQKPLIAVRAWNGALALAAAVAVLRPHLSWVARAPRCSVLHAPRQSHALTLRCAPPQRDDMPGDVSQETVEIITASLDKFLASENYEVRRCCRWRLPLHVAAAPLRYRARHWSSRLRVRVWLRSPRSAPSHPPERPRRRRRRRVRRRWTRSSAPRGTCASARALRTT